MKLEDAAQRAREIRRRYAELETQRHGRAWTAVDLMNGLTGDVGDLAKLVGAYAGIRQGPERLSEALEHELADCLWSVLVLADAVDVDLGAAFEATMDQLEDHLTECLQ